jgi:hypothetical protein
MFFKSNLQKCIMWLKMLGKWQQEWMKSCTNEHTNKNKVKFSTTIFLFCIFNFEIFYHIILLLITWFLYKFASEVKMIYNSENPLSFITTCRLVPKSPIIYTPPPPPFTWHILQIIVDCLSFVVTKCVLF